MTRVVDLIMLIRNLERVASREIDRRLIALRTYLMAMPDSIANVIFIQWMVISFGADPVHRRCECAQFSD
jgi:hypothetical protein